MTHLTDTGFVDPHATIRIDKMNDARRNGIGGIVIDEGSLFDFGGDEFGQHGEFLRHVQFATIPIDERTRRRCLQIAGDDFLRVTGSLDVIQNVNGHRTTVGGTHPVQMENFGDFVGGARIPIQSTRNVNGGGFDAVAIESPEDFLAANVFVNDHGVVDQHFGNARVLCHHLNELEFVGQGLLAMGHRFPLDPLADFAHGERTLAPHHHATTIRRLFQERVDGIATPRGVVGISVFRPEETPFGTIIQDLGDDFPTRRTRASGDALLHHEQGIPAMGTTIVVTRQNDAGQDGGGVVHTFAFFFGETTTS